MAQYFRTFLFFCLTPLALAAGGIHYVVDFEGLNDAQALKALKSVSSLSSLNKHPPASINALRYRADADTPHLLQVLQAYGYYEARIRIQIQEILERVEVIVWIDPGPVYTLEQYAVHLYCQLPEGSSTCPPIRLSEIDVTLGKPARAKQILQAELNALEVLSQRGYPLASVEKREVVADGQTKTVRVAVEIKTGEKATFGPVTYTGNRKIKSLYLEQKMAWSEGEPYNSVLVEQTQQALMDSGLFSSVYITHEERPNAQGQLPMKIEVSETKHRSVNVGVSYQTVFGPGITFGWENRNVGGMGRKLGLQGDVTRISHSGIATYAHPDFLRVGQDYIWQAEAAHKALPKAYSMRSYSVMHRIDRRFGKRIRAALGLQGERLYVTDSAQNGNFWLLEAPLYVRLSTANSLLDPTQGVTVEFTTTPAMNIGDTRDYYLVQEAAESSYHPLNKSRSIVIAQQLTLGTILSPRLKNVPLSKRFLGGSEENLRGYRYQTVSPFVHGKPIGGRSAIYFTLEMRLRLTKTLGFVPFFDIGNVYTKECPSWDGKWFKSVGLGVRYFSFMGPFRLDLAFPLDRRKGIDRVYNVLVSIGQTF